MDLCHFCIIFLRFPSAYTHGSFHFSLFRIHFFFFLLGVVRLIWSFGWLLITVTADRFIWATAHTHTHTSHFECPFWCRRKRNVGEGERRHCCWYQTSNWFRLADMAIGQFVGILLYYYYYMPAMLSTYRWANLIKSLFVRTSRAHSLSVLFDSI